MARRWGTSAPGVMAVPASLALLALLAATGRCLRLQAAAPSPSDLLPADLSVMLGLKAKYGKKADLSSWTPTQSCGRWKGVRCAWGYVEGIYLQGLGLGGPFPRTVTKLPRLRWLEIDGNNFTGTLPVAFSAQTRLEVLKLGGNLLTGPLPPEYVTLPKLYKLYVNQNRLSGNIPAVWARRGFQEAYFDSNRFSGPFPTPICNWTGLQKLRIGGNSWTGNIPECISQLTDMRSLYIDNAGVSGRIPVGISAMKKLNYLFLNGNKLTGPVPATIGENSELDTLFLSGNRLGGPLPKSMGKLKKLKAWVMEFNRITGTIPPEIGDMTKVERILLDNNRLSGKIPSTIGKLKQLTILLLEGNSLFGTVPPEIPLGCSSLVQFNVESNQLSGTPPNVFSSPRISQINIRSNYFIGGMNYRTPNGKPICPPLKTNAWIHSSTAFNCLTKKSTCGPKYDELQYKAIYCQNFCGANGPRGPCGGNGQCRYIPGPKKGRLTPTACICNRGFKPTRNRRSCVKA